MWNDSLHKDKLYRKDFNENQKRFSGALNENSEHLIKYKFTHSIPLIVDKNDNKIYKEFYETLMRVVKRIVINYDIDSDIQKIIQLPERAVELINAADYQYHLGSLRPDFLVDESMNFKMNEINARFPFNGFFHCFYVNDSLNSLDILKNDGVSSILEINNLPDSFKRIYGNTLLLKDSEGDWDVKLYWEYLKNKGKEFYKIKPEKLEINEGKFFGDNNLESVVMELKQREIMKHLTPEHIKLLGKYNQLNDIRSVLIAHDKRLLAALYDKDILCKYATEDERQVLLSHLIETYAINSPGDLKNEYIENKDKWVLKHALKGKSKQLYLGEDYNGDDWLKICKSTKGEPFVAQRRVLEHEFDIYMPHIDNFKIPLYGMLMGVDGKFISQGVFRGSDYDITGIWDGFMFVPIAIQK